MGSRGSRYGERVRETVIGIMGPGKGTSQEVLVLAQQLGALVAQNGWTLLTGGRPEGVMEAASKGAKLHGGRTVGVLPYREYDAAKVSAYVDLPILTGMGEARNFVNVLTSQVVLVCGMGSGTASEAALAIKANRPVVLVAPDRTTAEFFRSITNGLRVAEDAATAIRMTKDLLESVKE
jgi:uncharacterized protein (TIGR00725 family)